MVPVQAVSIIGVVYESNQYRSRIIGHVVKLARLKRARERAALSQQELAAKAGISRVTVARVEACLDEPQPRTVRKLAEALGVEPEALMAMEE